MRLSRRSDFLEDLWETGTLPDMDTIVGGFDVELATGPLPNLPRLNHRKYIYRDEKKGTVYLGYNLIGPLSHWKEVGRFEAYPTTVDDRYVLKLFYKDWKVVDYVVEIGPNLFLGRMYICDRFVGFFYMSHTWDFPVRNKAYSFGMDLAAVGTRDASVFHAKCPICNSPNVSYTEGKKPPEWRCNRCDASGIVNVSDV